MTGRPDGALDTVVLDLDGTLVDSVYQHTVAWQEAFRQVGIVVPGWRVHRAIGMGGDRLVTEVAGERVEAAVGEDVRSRHADEFEARISQVTAMEGASELLEELRRKSLRVVLASSAEKSMTQQLLDKVDGSGQLLDEQVSGSEADRSKPSPELIELALERVGGGRALVVGDAVWDVRAAAQAGVPCIGLLCGGFGEAELRDAGAEEVFEGPRDLLDRWEDSLLARG